jgi:hypothetical protein
MGRVIVCHPLPSRPSSCFLPSQRQSDQRGKRNAKAGIRKTTEIGSAVQFEKLLSILLEDRGGIAPTHFRPRH